MANSHPEETSGANGEPLSPQPDTEILGLFQRDPERAWRLFIERYADLIFSQLRRLGFDYDQTMDRFVYICEKLCEQDFRRLKTIRYAGRSGDLTPWVRQVVKRLSINWVWSVEGRKRLLKSIARLPDHEQRIFELYFWKGLSPSGIYEQLQLEHHVDVGPVEIFDALERIFSHLSAKKLWRLLSHLARTRQAVSLDQIDEETGIGVEPADGRANPEEALLRKEAEQHLDRALGHLSPRERLVLQLRYEEGMAVGDIAEMLHLDEKEVKRSIKATLGALRRRLE